MSTAEPTNTPEIDPDAEPPVPKRRGRSAVQGLIDPEDQSDNARRNRNAVTFARRLKPLADYFVACVSAVGDGRYLTDDHVNVNKFYSELDYVGVYGKRAGVGATLKAMISAAQLKKLLRVNRGDTSLPTIDTLEIMALVMAHATGSRVETTHLVGLITSRDDVAALRGDASAIDAPTVLSQEALAEARAMNLRSEYAALPSANRVAIAPDLLGMIATDLSYTLAAPYDQLRILASLELKSNSYDPARIETLSGGHWDIKALKALANNTIDPNDLTIARVRALPGLIYDYDRRSLITMDFLRDCFEIH
jgi:hypothetical protein